MPSCVACGSELEPPVRTPHTVYVKTFYRIAGQYYCHHHTIRAAVAAGVITKVRVGSGSDTVFLAPRHWPRFEVCWRVVGQRLRHRAPGAGSPGRGLAQRHLVERGGGHRGPAGTARLGHPELCAQHDIEPSARMGEVDDPNDAHLHRCCR